jgi:hypothetical protein
LYRLEPLSKKSLNRALVYLVYDIGSFEIDVEATVAPYFEFIFEEELNAWHRLESDWPARRDFATFLAWFEVEYHSMVIDLV